MNFGSKIMSTDWPGLASTTPPAGAAGPQLAPGPQSVPVPGSAPVPG